MLDLSKLSENEQQAVREIYQQLVLGNANRAWEIWSSKHPNSSTMSWLKGLRQREPKGVGVFVAMYDLIVNALRDQFDNFISMIKTLYNQFFTSKDETDDIEKEAATFLKDDPTSKTYWDSVKEMVTRFISLLWEKKNDWIKNFMSGPAKLFKLGLYVFVKILNLLKRVGVQLWDWFFSKPWLVSIIFTIITIVRDYLCEQWFGTGSEILVNEGWRFPGIQTMKQIGPFSPALYSISLMIIDKFVDTKSFEFFWSTIEWLAATVSEPLFSTFSFLASSTNAGVQKLVNALQATLKILGTVVWWLLKQATKNGIKAFIPQLYQAHSVYLVWSFFWAPCVGSNKAVGAIEQQNTQKVDEAEATKQIEENIKMDVKNAIETVLGATQKGQQSPEIQKTIDESINNFHLLNISQDPFYNKTTPIQLSEIPAAEVAKGGEFILKNLQKSTNIIF